MPVIPGVCWPYNNNDNDDDGNNNDDNDDNNNNDNDDDTYLAYVGFDGLVQHLWEVESLLLRDHTVHHLRHRERALLTKYDELIQIKIELKCFFFEF